jgi:hypothetical protein
MGKGREPEIILKTDERKLVLEIGGKCHRPRHATREEISSLLRCGIVG